MVNGAESQPEILPLTLTPICQGRWRIHNPNSFDILVSWEAHGGRESGNILLPANGDFIFQGPQHSVTIALFANGQTVPVEHLPADCQNGNQHGMNLPDSQGHPVVMPPSYDSLPMLYNHNPANQTDNRCSHTNTNPVTQAYSQLDCTRIEYQYDALYRIRAAYYFDGTNLPDVSFDFGLTNNGPDEGYRTRSTNRYFYEYDQRGNRSNLTAYNDGSMIPSYGETYTYNEANQLKHQHIAGGTTYTYSYDANGNRTSETPPDSTSSYFATFYRYNSANQLISVQVGVSNQGLTNIGIEQRYLYNGDGTRLRQEIDDTARNKQQTIEYLWDVSGSLPQVLSEHSILQGEQREINYLFGLNRIAQQSNGQWMYFAYDGLGSIRQLTDNNAVQHEAGHFDPYGNLIDDYTRQSSVGFAGEQSDPSGLQYLRARYYDSRTGQFLSKDPVNGAVGGPSIAYNAYPYAMANPINNTDPSGCVAITAAVAGAVALRFAIGFLIDAGMQAAFNCGHVDWGQAAISGGVSVATMGLDKAAWGLRFGAEVALETAAFGAYRTAQGQNYDWASELAWNVVGNAAGEAIGEGIGALGRNADFDAPRLRGDADSPTMRCNACVCGGNSFSADTMVATPDGDVPISEIEVGDTVLAYNEETGTTGEYTVTDTISHEDEVIVTLTVNGEEIETTPWHLFYTDEGWIEAGDLEAGDLLLSLGGVYGEVEGILIEVRTQTMYDLTVEEVHTFAVGDGDWVVHNQNPFNSLNCLILNERGIRGVLRNNNIDDDSFVSSIQTFTGKNFYQMRMAQLEGRARFDLIGEGALYDDLIERATVIEYGLYNLPAYRGPIYRGMELNSLEDLQGVLGDNVTVDTMLEFRSLQSFSRTPNLGMIQSRNTVLFIPNASEGVAIESISLVRKELEVLVPSGGFYRITNITENPGGIFGRNTRWLIQLENQ